MGCFVVAEFLLTSASRGPSAIAEPLVSISSGRMLTSRFDYQHWVPYNTPLLNYGHTTDKQRDRRPDGQTDHSIA